MTSRVPSGAPRMAGPPAQHRGRCRRAADNLDDQQTWTAGDIVGEKVADWRNPVTRARASKGT
jgi:hypothetical protein